MAEKFAIGKIHAHVNTAFHLKFNTFEKNSLI